MKKRMTFQNLDTERELLVDFMITEEQGHWVARLEYPGGDPAEVKAPTFYGTTPEQAERQLRKVFEKDFELIAEAPLEG